MRAALAHAAPPTDASLALAFVGDASMRALNRRHRGVDRTTDVLSFGQALPRGVRGAAATAHLSRAIDGSLELGDVVISAEVAERQARRRGWTLAEEVALLAAHGALHLFGYEDETRTGYREMRRLGEEALSIARLATRRARARRNTRRPVSATQDG